MSERLMSETLFGLAEKIVGVLDEAIAEREVLRERVAELEHGMNQITRVLTNVAGWNGSNEPTRAEQCIGEIVWPLHYSTKGTEHE